MSKFLQFHTYMFDPCTRVAGISCVGTNLPVKATTLINEWVIKHVLPGQLMNNGQNHLVVLGQGWAIPAQHIQYLRFCLNDSMWVLTPSPDIYISCFYIPRLSECTMCSLWTAQFTECGTEDSVCFYVLYITALMMPNRGFPLTLSPCHFLTLPFITPSGPFLFAPPSIILFTAVIISDVTVAMGAVR